MAHKQHYIHPAHMKTFFFFQRYLSKLLCSVIAWMKRDTFCRIMESFMWKTNPHCSNTVNYKNGPVACSARIREDVVRSATGRYRTSIIEFLPTINHSTKQKRWSPSLFQKYSALLRTYGSIKLLFSIKVIYFTCNMYYEEAISYSIIN